MPQERKNKFNRLNILAKIYGRQAPLSAVNLIFLFPCQLQHRFRLLLYHRIIIPAMGNQAVRAILYPLVGICKVTAAPVSKGI